eukprot:851995-Pyramimonas_sp.AAC.1
MQPPRLHQLVAPDLLLLALFNCAGAGRCGEVVAFQLALALLARTVNAADAMKKSKMRPGKSVKRVGLAGRLTIPRNKGWPFTRNSSLVMSTSPMASQGMPLSSASCTYSATRFDCTSVPRFASDSCSERRRKMEAAREPPGTSPRICASTARPGSITKIAHCRL